MPVVKNIEPSAVLIDCSPQQRRLAAQRHEHFVQMPRDAGLATRSLDAMRKASAGSSHGSRGSGAIEDGEWVRVVGLHELTTDNE